MKMKPQIALWDKEAEYEYFEWCTEFLAANQQ